MQADCEFLDECLFFLKYNNRESIAWKGLIRIYCKGGLPFLCERRRRFLDTGRQPGENTMPTGKLVSRGFSALP